MAAMYRDSLRSAQSNSIYSTDGSSYDSSPLDSIIREYPLPAANASQSASKNSFNFSPVSYSGTPNTPESSGGRFQRLQQQPRGADAPSRLREYSPARVEETIIQPMSDPQAHDRTNSSPLLHARFHSPSDGVSIDARETHEQPAPSGTEDSFIDLRDSGTFTPVNDSSYNSYGYAPHTHDIPARTDHGATPVLAFTPPQPPPFAQTQTSHFSPAAPHTAEPPASTQSKLFAHEYLSTGNSGNRNPNAKDDSVDRSSWGTQHSDANNTRQTWMTSTSSVTVGDPFAFRHYETPQASPNDTSKFAPTVVVHEPETLNPHLAKGPTSMPHDTPDTEADTVVDVYAYAPPSPLDPPAQGRVPSKVPVATRYNFSRPMRSDAAGGGYTSPLTSMPEQDSEYSTMSASNDLPQAIMGFPEPPLPNNSNNNATQPPLLPSQYTQPLTQESEMPLRRRATARMSIPKTVPNLAYTDDPLSPNPKKQPLDGITESGGTDNEMYLSSSPRKAGGGTQSPIPRSLSPAPDRSRSASPVGSAISSGSPRMNAPSPLPGPPRTYDVPYSYNVTVTEVQYDSPQNHHNVSTSSHSDHSGSLHATRYSAGGSTLPPAPREVVALPSSPLPTMPRPGSTHSLYSRYSFYSVGDLPNSGASTPLGWDKNSKRTGSGSNSPAGRTPTPTAGTAKGSGDGTVGDDSGLPYLRADASTAESSHAHVMTPQECLLLGISHHEANRLEESAHWFEKAATERGGCGVGMLMWGLSLRHAWGVPKDERAAFWWLRRAAECAVADMERANDANLDRGDGAKDPERERDRKAVQSELVLAVYEVGQCFFHGWGVETDKKMAVSYFQVAARLGDVDAQLELGFCYANGKGCKKDLKEAAKWYRAAAAQGASTVGLAWIYKPKYGGDENEKTIEKPGNITLPSSAASNAPSIKSTKSDGRRRLKKPPPSSRANNSARSRSPARTEFSSVLDSTYLHTPTS